MADVRPYPRSALRPLAGRARRRNRSALRRDRRRAARAAGRALRRTTSSSSTCRGPRRRRSLRARRRAAGAPGRRTASSSRTTTGRSGRSSRTTPTPRERAGPGAGSSARIRVTEYGPGLVRPHERTQPGPKEDRLRLTRATKHNLSPIFVLHAGDAWQPPRPRTRRRALLRGHRRRRHRPPRLADRRRRRPRGRSPSSSSDSELLIADGHHRYETARTYARRDRRRGRPPLHARLPRLARRPGPLRLRDQPPPPRPQRRPAEAAPRHVLDLFDLEQVEEDELVPDRGLRRRSPSATWTPTTASPTACG